MGGSISGSLYKGSYCFGSVFRATNSLISRLLCQHKSASSLSRMRRHAARLFIRIVRSRWEAPKTRGTYNVDPK